MHANEGTGSQRHGQTATDRLQCQRTTPPSVKDKMLYQLHQRPNNEVDELVDKILEKVIHVESLFKANANMEIKKASMEILYTVQILKRLNADTQAARLAQ